MQAVIARRFVQVEATFADCTCALRPAAGLPRRSSLRLQLADCGLRLAAGPPRPDGVVCGLWLADYGSQHRCPVACRRALRPAACGLRLAWASPKNHVVSLKCVVALLTSPGRIPRKPQLQALNPRSIISPPSPLLGGSLVNRKGFQRFSNFLPVLRLAACGLQLAT